MASGRILWGAVSTDILYPVLIALGCGIFAALVHRLTKPRPTRDDIATPQLMSSDDRTGQGADIGTTGGVQPTEARTEALALSAWHRSYEDALLCFIEAVDALEGEAEIASDVSAELHAALEAHPAAEMRGELAGLESSAGAMIEAASRSDEDAVDRHRVIYREYRISWLERIDQFAVDPKRVRRAIHSHHR
jgi:hypothetical protein